MASGCSLVDELSEDGGSLVTERNVRALDVGPLAIDAKLDLYLRCRDSLGQEMQVSWTRLADQLGEDGRVGKRRVYVYPVAAATFRTCDVAVGEGPELDPPMVDIERTALATVVAARQFASLTRTLDEYADAQGHRKDRGASVAAAYPLLAESHERWRNLDRLLGLYLATEKSANDPALLTLLQRNGLDLQYYTQALVVHARPYVACATGESVQPDACTASFDTLDEAYQDFAAYSNLHPREADTVFWMRTFAEDAKRFHAMAQKLEKERRRTQQAERDLLASYRVLLRDADNLDFSFGLQVSEFEMPALPRRRGRGRGQQGSRRGAPRP